MVRVRTQIYEGFCGVETLTSGGGLPSVNVSADDEGDVFLIGISEGRHDLGDGGVSMAYRARKEGGSLARAGARIGGEGRDAEVPNWERGRRRGVGVRVVAVIFACTH